MRKFYIICCLIFFSLGSSYCQLPNNSFETWNQGLPDGWFSALIPGYTLLEQSTDAHTGSYCAKLNVDTVSGFPIATSLMTGNGNSITTPISYVPASVDFWYKMNADSGDQLSALVFVYSAGNMVGLGSVQLNSAANYTQASISVLNLTGTLTADSINVSFLINNPAGYIHYGSAAKIDDITLTVSAGVNDLIKSNADLLISPNPLSDRLNLTFESKKPGYVSINIYSQNGKCVNSIITPIVKGSNSISVSADELANGSYYCNLKSDNQNITKPFVVKK